MENKVQVKAQDSGSLENRLKTNAGYGTNNLNDFIFSLFTLKNTDTVLDLCCGRGNQTLRFAKNAAQVYSLDASAESLATINQQGMANIKTVEMDIDLFPDSTIFEKESLDIIHCAYGLYYSKRAAEVIQKAYELLKPGGKLVVVGPTDENNETLFTLIESVYKIDPWIIYTSRDFMNTLVVPESKKIFSDVKSEFFFNTVSYPSAEELYTYIASSTMYQKEKDTELKQAIERAFINNQPFTITKKAMGLIATK